MHRTISREEFEKACVKLDDHLSGITRLAIYQIQQLLAITEHYEWQERQRIIDKHKRKLAAREATNE